MNRWNKEIDKTMAIIESCNTLEQLTVADKFAKQCVKSFGFRPIDINFSEHWDAIFQLTIDERAEEIKQNDWIDLPGEESEWV